MAGRRARRFAACGGTDQFDDAPRDRRRRIDPAHRPGREPLEAVEQQRKMRAGEHHGVGALARRRSTKQGAISARIAHRRPAWPASAASASGASRAGADQREVAALADSWRISAWVYSRATVASVPSTETRFDCEAAQAGLIAGTVPTKGKVKRCAQRGQHLHRGGVAGDHHEVGAVRRDEAFHQADDALDQLGLGDLAVGKQRIVRRIDEARIGPRARDLAEHRQAADAGIEHQDLRGTHDARASPRGRPERNAASRDSRPPGRGAARPPAAAARSFGSPRPRGRLIVPP